MKPTKYTWVMANSGKFHLVTSRDAEDLMSRRRRSNLRLMGTVCFYELVPAGVNELPPKVSVTWCKLCRRWAEQRLQGDDRAEWIRAGIRPPQPQFIILGDVPVVGEGEAAQ